jgi:hypothetical protein
VDEEHRTRLVENKENVIKPRPGPEKKRKELDVTK